MTVQIASTTPKGHAPERKPYELESAQPNANAKTKAGARRSCAYIIIMNVSTITPYKVKTIGVLYGMTMTALLVEDLWCRRPDMTLGPLPSTGA
jgi:hypothetical protein